MSCTPKPDTNYSALCVTYSWFLNTLHCTSQPPTPCLTNSWLYTVHNNVIHILLTKLLIVLTVANCYTVPDYLKTWISLCCMLNQIWWRHRWKRRASNAQPFSKRKGCNLKFTHINTKSITSLKSWIKKNSRKCGSEQNRNNLVKI